MLTDCAEDTSVAMCENAQKSFSISSCLDVKEQITSYMKLDVAFAKRQ